jgi:hypothetical protein
MEARFRETEADIWEADLEYRVKMREEVESEK